jgi:hypothetical protein
MALQNLTEFRWNKARNDAALLLAADEKTDTEIAEAVGVSRQTLHTWKQHPDFQAKIKEHIAEFEASIKRYAIAKRRNRVARQNADWERLERVREMRANNPAFGGVAGDETGLLVQQWKVIGTGHNAQTVQEVVVDTALVKARSELEKHTAGELDQTPPTRVRHGGDDSAPPIETHNRTEVQIVDADAYNREFAALLGVGDGTSDGDGDVPPQSRLHAAPADDEAGALPRP